MPRSGDAVEQLAELAHAALDDPRPLLDVAARAARREDSRVRQDGGETRSLASRQPVGRLVEIGLCSRLGTVDAGSHLGHVEIDLDDPSLAPEKLDLWREQHLEQ